MRSGSGPVPPGAMVGGKVKDSTATAQALRQLLARTEITDQRAFVAVSDTLATFRILHLPRASTESEVAAAVARELPLDSDKIAAKWIDVSDANARRTVYAAAWDRAELTAVTDTLKSVGVEPAVVELKSASLARAINEPSCIVADLCSEPAEIVLIDGSVPQVWHSVDGAPTDDVIARLVAPIRSVLRFYRRRHEIDFGPSSPVLVAAEQVFTDDQLQRLATEVGQPVIPLPAPPRVPPHVRHATYLGCLGLIMRRGT